MANCSERALSHGCGVYQRVFSASASVLAANQTYLPNRVCRQQQGCTANGVVASLPHQRAYTENQMQIGIRYVFISTIAANCDAFPQESQFQPLLSVVEWFTQNQTVRTATPA